MSDDSDFDVTDDVTDVDGAEPVRGRVTSARQEKETEDVSAIPYDDDDESWDSFDEEEGGLPGRARRIYVNRWTALLAAVVIGAACFYAGVRVEKSKVGTGSTAASGFAAIASRLGAAGGASTTASKGGSAAASRFGGAGGFGGGGGFAGGGRFGGAGGGGTSGTVSSIDGDTVYVTDTAGNTVAVKLTSSTTLKKSETVATNKIFPGDTLVITGSTAKNGTVTATAVTDSGASTTGSTASGTGSSSSSSTSGLNSLF